MHHLAKLPLLIWVLLAIPVSADELEISAERIASGGRWNAMMVPEEDRNLLLIEDSQSGEIFEMGGLGGFELQAVSWAETGLLELTGPTEKWFVEVEAGESSDSLAVQPIFRLHSMELIHKNQTQGWVGASSQVNNRSGYLGEVSRLNDKFKRENNRKNTRYVPKRQD